MKKLTVFSIAIIVLCCMWTTGLVRAETNDMIIGEWQGFYGKDEIRFIFNADKTFVAKSKNASFGGTYQVDMTKNPVPLDFNMEKDGQKEALFTIFEILDENKIRMEEPSPERPVDFNRDPVVFTRMDSVLTPTQETDQPQTTPGDGETSEVFKAKPLQ